jgi:pentapeptide MXKDX repeat protein
MVGRIKASLAFTALAAAFAFQAPLGAQESTQQEKTQSDTMKQDSMKQDKMGQDKMSHEKMSAKSKKKTKSDKMNKVEKKAARWTTRRAPAEKKLRCRSGVAKAAPARLAGRKSKEARHKICGLPGADLKQYQTRKRVALS